MAKNTTSTFIHELKLVLSLAQEKVLGKRLNVARLIYNACLGEALRRHKLMRESKIYQRAIAMPYRIKNANGKGIVNQDRRNLFRLAQEVHQFREYDLHGYVKQLRLGTWLGDHIDAATAQKLATRAFNSVQQYALRKRGKPRFRVANRFHSVESKSNQAGIRWQDGRVKWRGLNIGVELDLKDKHGLESYALLCRTKYVRLVRRIQKGKSIWYAQLVQEGSPYIKLKNTLGNAIVGLDIGPSSIAIVGDSSAKLQAFCPEVEDYTSEIKVLQRKMSRSHREMNPDNYEMDRVVENANGRKVLKLGKVKKGMRKWRHSQRYQSMQTRLAELQRKMSASRKRAHGELANQIIGIGKVIKTEKLSYKGFQKRYGRSVSKRAPGLFIEKLRYKAANAGGEVIEFSTRSTALSQMCQCGNKRKKALSERWHHCKECGIRGQRDLYSAYLARFVHEDRLDTSRADEAWVGAGAL